MKVVAPSIEVFKTKDEAEKDILLIEKAGRLCYRSESSISEGSAEKFIKNIIKSGHESVIEHASVSIRIICSRSCSHQIVRHRLASFSQESQRYCNYSKDKFGNEVVFIEPPSYDDMMGAEYINQLKSAEENYFKLIRMGQKPEEARAVLPNSTKTELIMTANLREWRHFIKVRTGRGAEYEIRFIAGKILEELYQLYPMVFEDLANI